jgi:hypothetical protein
LSVGALTLDGVGDSIDRVERQTGSDQETALAPSEPVAASAEPALAGAAPTGLVLRLQRGAGNAAVARLLQRQAAGTVPPPPAQELHGGGVPVERVIARALRFDKSLLTDSTSGLTKEFSLKAIRSAYKAYEPSADTNPARELKLLNELHAEVLHWIKSTQDRAREKFNEPNLSKANLPALLTSEELFKWQIVNSLNTAVAQEIVNVKLREKLERRGALQIVEQLGLSLALVKEMSDLDVQELVTVQADLQAGRPVVPDALLQGLRKTLGDDPVKLIISALLRKNIGLVSKAMEAVFEDPKYRLVDTGESASGATKAQQLADKYIKSVDLLEQQHMQQQQQQQPVTDLAKWTAEDVEIQELKKNRAVLSNLAGTAAARKVGDSTLRKLTVEEITGILLYSTRLYGKINYLLRSRLHELSRNKQAIAKLAVSGLNKLDAYKGIVYRHSKNFPGYEKVNQEGAIVVDTTFLSTSMTQAGCDNAAEGHEVCEVITSKQGREITMISAFDEGEVLFRPGTRFRVTRVVRPDSHGNWEFETLRHILKSTKKDKFQMVVYKEEA